jgi:hypothetical protein
MLESMTELKEMITAPRYSQESPGEREAREVAEKTMPEGIPEQYYSDDGESENSDVGVFQQI